MGSVRVVSEAEHRRVRWHNGLGWTTEIVAEPSAASWRWRLSLAESDAPAAFSCLPGVDRELVLIDGSALRLTTAGREPVTVEPGESHRFAGEDEVDGEPVGGPTRQLNVMWRRDLLRAEVTRHRGPNSLTLPSRPADQVALVALGGAAYLGLGDDSTRLEAGQTAVVEAPGEAVVARLVDGGLLVVVRLTAT